MRLCGVRSTVSRSPTTSSIRWTAATSNPRDRELARSFAPGRRGGSAPRRLSRGIHPDDGESRRTSASRAETGQILLDGPVPAACLQAAVVPGAGRPPILRHLTERLPVMVTPAWIDSPSSRSPSTMPSAASSPPPICHPGRTARSTSVVPTCSPIATSSGPMPRSPASARRIVSVPVLTPWLASHWVGVVTPVPAGLAKPLVGSLVHPVVRRESDLTPPRHPLPDRGERGDPVGAGGGAGRHGTAPAGVRVPSPPASSWALATQPKSRWYRALEKPPWQPPPETFGVVWTPLYAIIAAVSAQHPDHTRPGGTRGGGHGIHRPWGQPHPQRIVGVLFFRVRHLPVATAGRGGARRVQHRSRARGEHRTTPRNPPRDVCRVDHLRHCPHRRRGGATAGAGDDRTVRVPARRGVRQSDHVPPHGNRRVDGDGSPWMARMWWSPRRPVPGN